MKQHFLGIKPITGNAQITVTDDIQLTQQGATLFEQLSVQTLSMNQGVMITFDSAITNIGSLLCHAIAGTGGETYEIYVKNNVGDTWELIKTVVAQAVTNQNDRLFNIHVNVDVSELLAVLTPEQVAIIAKFTTQQKTAIATLTKLQQIVLATPSLITAPTIEQLAIINGYLTTQQKAYFLSTTPVLTDEQLAVIAADKAEVARINAVLKAGSFIEDDEAMMLIFGVAVTVIGVMNVLNAGGGYEELRAIGISDTNALRALSVFNISSDQTKINVENACNKIKTDFNALVSLRSYLMTLETTLPDFDAYIQTLRTNVPQETLLAWSATYP